MQPNTLGNKRTHPKKPFLVLVPALLVVGCGLTDPDRPEIGGTWLAQDDQEGRWEFELSGSSAVAGTFLITFPGESFALTGLVSGEYDYPAVSLSFEISFFDESLSCDFRGTMAESGQTIGGTASCAGAGETFSSALDLRRES